MSDEVNTKLFNSRINQFVKHLDNDRDNDNGSDNGADKRCISTYSQKQQDQDQNQNQNQDQDQANIKLTKELEGLFKPISEEDDAIGEDVSFDLQVFEMNNVNFDEVDDDIIIESRDAKQTTVNQSKQVSIPKAPNSKKDINSNNSIQLTLNPKLSRQSSKTSMNSDNDVLSMLNESPTFKCYQCKELDLKVQKLESELNSIKLLF